MDMSRPWYWSTINDLSGHFSPGVNQYNAQSYYYFQRSLYQRVFSLFDIDIPEEWDKDFFKFVLYGVGFVIVMDTKKYGVIPQYGTLSDYGIYYQPTKATVASPFIQSERMTIWKDCGIIKLTPDYIGISDVVNYYATKLAVLDGTLNQSIINSRLAYVLAAKDKRSAQTIKAVMDKIQSGQSTVVFDEKIKSDAFGNDEPWNFVDFEVQKNYITDKLIADFHEIYNLFDQEVGLPNNPSINKKERLLSNEIESNNAETVSRLTTWEDSIESTVKRVNDMFGLSISIKRREYDTGATGAKEAGGDTDVNV